MIGHVRLSHFNAHYQLQNYAIAYVVCESLICGSNNND